jgi:hypothetical protein
MLHCAHALPVESCLNRRIVTKASKSFLSHDEGEGVRGPDSSTVHGSMDRVCTAEDSRDARDGI